MRAFAIAVLLAISSAGQCAATEYAAAQFRYAPKLGEPLFGVGNVTI